MQRPLHCRHLPPRRAAFNFEPPPKRPKRWLIPLLVVLGFLGVVAFLTQTGAMPFIYTLF